MAIVAIACGASAPGSTSAGGAGGAIGSAGVGGISGVAGNSGAGVGGISGAGGSGGLAPGTCGIYRRISLPGAPADALAAAPTVRQPEPDRFVQRVAGGFAVGPWRDTPTTIPFRLNWIRIDPDGATQTPYSAQSSVVGLQSFNMATPNRVVLVAQFDFYEFRTVIFDDPGTITWGVAKLFTGEDTKFLVARGAASLDGQRGLVMIADTSHPPWLVMFAADGTSVGDVLARTADGTCYSVVPTEHGAAFTSIEGNTFHLIERSAAGTTALDVEIPNVPRQANPMDCPRLALTEDGFAIVAFGGRADGDGWNLHRVARDGTISSEPWDALLGCTSVAFAMVGDAAIATCARPSEANIIKRTHGQDQRFPIERAGTKIHSEPGSLYLNVTYTQPSDGTGLPREIIEIRCAD